MLTYIAQEEDFPILRMLTDDAPMFKIEPINLRFVLVIGIIIALMIPLLFVFVLVQEREMHYEKALSDVAAAWAAEQAVAGPMVFIRQRDRDDDSNRIGFEKSEWVYMPNMQNMTFDASHEMRNRGIYRIPVFTANVATQATFDPLDVAGLSGEVEQVSIAIGISDSRGIRNISINQNGSELTELVSSQLRGIGSVVLVDIPVADLQEQSTVAVELELRGTSRFSMLPIGDTTNVSMTSDWPDPSFDGRFLPDSRTVNTNGFTASWSTHALSRGFPSLVNVEELEQTLRSFEYGIRRPVDLGYTILNLNTPYRAIERSVKYGALFIVMTMIGIVCIELVSKSRFHIIQYGVVGAGLVVFFLTLLSLSEHVGFGIGYILAAVILTTMNVGYLWFVSRSTPVAIAMASGLAILYIALYFVLQLNEYALMVGTVLLLILLAAVMYATRSLSKPGENVAVSYTDSAT